MSLLNPPKHWIVIYADPSGWRVEKSDLGHYGVSRDDGSQFVGVPPVMGEIFERAAAERERWNDPAIEPRGERVLVLHRSGIDIGSLRTDREGRRWWESDVEGYDLHGVRGWRELPPE